jgi:hypothetical protein
MAESVISRTTLVDRNRTVIYSHLSNSRHSEPKVKPIRDELRKPEDRREKKTVALNL